MLVLGNYSNCPLNKTNTLIKMMMRIISKAKFSKRMMNHLVYEDEDRSQPFNQI